MGTQCSKFFGHTAIAAIVFVFVVVFHYLSCYYFFSRGLGLASIDRFV